MVGVGNFFLCVCEMQKAHHDLCCAQFKYPCVTRFVTMVSVLQCKDCKLYHSCLNNLIIWKNNLYSQLNCLTLVICKYTFMSYLSFKRSHFYYQV